MHLFGYLYWLFSSFCKVNNRFDFWLTDDIQSWSQSRVELLVSSLIYLVVVIHSVLINVFKSVLELVGYNGYLNNIVISEPFYTSALSSRLTFITLSIPVYCSRHQYVLYVTVGKCNLRKKVKSESHFYA